VYVLYGCVGVVVVIDFDCFKDVNDFFGYYNGDVLFVVLVECFVGVVWFGDVVVWFGGDEFGIVLFEVSVVDVVYLCFVCGVFGVSRFLLCRCLKIRCVWVVCIVGWLVMWLRMRLCMVLVDVVVMWMR